MRVKFFFYPRWMWINRSSYKILRNKKTDWFKEWQIGFFLKKNYSQPTNITGGLLSNILSREGLGLFSAVHFESLWSRVWLFSQTVAGDLATSFPGPFPWLGGKRPWERGWWSSIWELQCSLFLQLIRWDNMNSCYFWELICMFFFLLSICEIILY